MRARYTMYGSPASHFAGKLRAYLNYKGVDYVERVPSALQTGLFGRQLGFRAVPILELQPNEYIVDTPLIMDELDKRHPERPVHARTPVQVFASMLLENWFDDGWIGVSMMTRWLHDENWDTLLGNELAQGLFPWLPGFIGKPIVGKTLKRYLSGALPYFGVTPEQEGLLSRWALNTLDRLEEHFEHHTYLFGGRPTPADYGLMGTTLCHLNRDPWPRREWMDPRPTLQKWVDFAGKGGAATGDLLEGDAVPATVTPIVEGLFAEFPVYIRGAVSRLKEKIEAEGLKSGDEITRILPKVEYPLLGEPFERNPLTYTIWRMQRIRETFEKMSPLDQEAVRQWCATIGDGDLPTMDLGPRLTRRGLTAALA
jgi:glutathione S-transferase